MAATDRERLRRAREQLDEWTYEARDGAYADLFEGVSSVLTDEELALLDRIDSDLIRRTGSGLWDSDEYGIVAPGTVDDGPTVVCIAHPEIPYEGYRGADSLDEATREQLNDVLWDYAERVAVRLQESLDGFATGDRE